MRGMRGMRGWRDERPCPHRTRAPTAPIEAHRVATVSLLAGSRGVVHRPGHAARGGSGRRGRGCRDRLGGSSRARAARMARPSVAAGRRGPARCRGAVVGPANAPGRECARRQCTESAVWPERDWRPATSNSMTRATKRPSRDLIRADAYRTLRGSGTSSGRGQVCAQWCAAWTRSNASSEAAAERRRNP